MRLGKTRKSYVETGHPSYNRSVMAKAHLVLAGSALWSFDLSEVLGVLMTLRSVVLSILSLLALIFLILNWQGITAPVPVNLIVEEIQAPLGLILLVILGGLWLFGIAWALMQQASTLVEIRKAYKEASANKSLADHAEMSRLEQTKEKLREEMTKNREELLAGIKEAIAVPTQSAQEAQTRLDAVEKALEKLSLRIEQIAEKAQIGPAPELPAPEPKKSGFFGFLGGSKAHKEEKTHTETAAEPVKTMSTTGTAPAASSEHAHNTTATTTEQVAQETPAVETNASGEEKPKEGFFKKMFH